MLSKSVFDSVEELVAYYGTMIGIPENIPEDCNVVCFRVSFGEGVKFSQVCKEDEHGFFRLGWGGEWEKSSESLDDELEFDKHLSHSRYVYLRLATKDNSDVFTPERLLGVKSNKGFIIGVLVSNAFADYIKPSYYVYTSKSPHKLEDIHKVKFYISDDSDETVSFEEYVRTFYEG